MSGDDKIRCADGCGAALSGGEEAAIDAAWSWLSIRGAWRCPACGRALRAASTMTGRAPTPEDAIGDPELAPGSRGALPKATAETITPPTVGRNP